MRRLNIYLKAKKNAGYYALFTALFLLCFVTWAELRAFDERRLTEYGARNHSGVVNSGLNAKASPSSAFYRKSPEEVEAETSGKGSGTVPKSTQEEAGKWITFEATAYVALCDSGCTGITATGYDVRNTIYSPKGHRVIAVDPSVVPLGALVVVKLADGTTFKARAMDTGGAIKGRRIDLLNGSVKEARAFGRQSVEVRILD